MTCSLPKDVVKLHVELGAPYQHSGLPACSPWYLQHCVQISKAMSLPSAAAPVLSPGQQSGKEKCLLEMYYPFSFLALTCIHSLIGPLAWIPSSGSSFLQALGLSATWPRLCLKPLVLAAALSMVQAGPISLGPAFWVARHYDTAILLYMLH